jgi:hypothetical protein
MKVSIILIMLISFFAVSGNAFADPGNTDICHKGKTINVSSSAVQAHINHGDYGFACELAPTAVALFRCGGPDLKILSVSTSVGVPLLAGHLVVGSSCSNSISLLMLNGFEPLHANTVYDSTLLDTVTDYGFSGPRVISQ